LFTERFITVPGKHPCEPIPDKFLVKTFTIDSNHTNRPAVAISINRFYINRFPVDHIGCELLCFLPEVLMLLGAVNAIQPYLLTPAIVHDGNGIAIGYTDYLSLPGER
jgi:hypothetical protein